MSCGDTIVNSVPRKAPADSHRLPAPVPLKKGGLAFTDEDEEVLVLFASQAATAIANARTHRDEQRSRADLPVIFISACGRDETIARALERGAVDYVVKPFSATELTARVRAALRRRTEMEPCALGDLAIRYEQREVTVAGRPLRLTATEYELLRILSVNAGRVVTYESLIRQLWHGPEPGDSDRVRTFVKQLRRKLGDDPARPVYIQNVRAVGYRMAEPQPQVRG